MLKTIGFQSIHSLASSNNLAELAQCLLERPQDVNKNDRYGRSPLMKAIKNQLIDNVLLLLDKGANINHIDMLRKTALHYAVEESFLDIATILIQRGADIHFKNLSGRTAIDECKSFSISNILKSTYSKYKYALSSSDTKKEVSCISPSDLRSLFADSPDNSIFCSDAVSCLDSDEEGLANETNKFTVSSSDTKQEVSCISESDLLSLFADSPESSIFCSDAASCLKSDQEGLANEPHKFSPLFDDSISFVSSSDTEGSAVCFPETGVKATFGDYCEKKPVRLNKISCLNQLFERKDRNDVEEIVSPHALMSKIGSDEGSTSLVKYATGSASDRSCKTASATSSRSSTLARTRDSEVKESYCWGSREEDEHHCRRLRKDN